MQGGTSPVGSPDGSELYFQQDTAVMAVSVEAAKIVLGPELSWERPRQVFAVNEFIDTSGRSYDVTSDGQRLIYVKRTKPTIDTRIHIVSNWPRARTPLHEPLA